MEGSERIFLKKGQRIELAQYQDGRNKEVYRILSVAGQGGSTVCYDAVREIDGQTGKLKEFYPVDSVIGVQKWFYSLDRLSNGQLVPSGGTVRKFDELCREYLKTYQLLIKVIADNPQNEILKNFIQIGDIRYGCIDSRIENEGIIARVKRKFGGLGADAHERATVYIWSTGIDGQRYDEHLNELRQQPDKNSDYKLYEILQTMVSLTDCIKALHTVGLMHLDIKPSNFLVPYKSDYAINPGSISIFDINTLYSIDNDEPRAVGTDGFSAPEIMRGKADNRSDIYSIGAMLFNAIVVSDDVTDGLYRDLYYKEIDQLVRHSKLISGAESNSDVRLMSKLANILKSCLARNPSDRYESCSKLLKELKEAESRLTQYITPVGQNKRLQIVEVNERGISDPVITIQKLLHDHPLYEVINPGETDIHVLVIGSGTYGQKFIDQCLQAGQMKGYTLHIHAVSDNPEVDLESYLQFRPAISKFVDINGSLKSDKERSYGTIVFETLKEAAGNPSEETSFRFRKVKSGSAGAAEKENNEIISEIIANAVENEMVYDYIFVALGDNRTNYSIAKCFSDTLIGWKMEIICPVCFISENGKKTTKKEQANMLYSVCINEIITPETINPMLDRMAFNTDISWNSNLNIDVAETHNKFVLDRYRYSSSMAYALSIKYKLYSIGIVQDIEAKALHGEDDRFVVVKDADEAAKVFADNILARRDTDSDAKEKFDTIVALEHRRWVLEKVTDGWTAPEDEKGNLDLESCVLNGTVKNAARHTHPCIVFGTEETPLSGQDYVIDGHKKWDDPNIDPNLDDLDRMSIELHQCFRAKANELKMENPLHSEDMEAIWRLISDEGEEVVRAYRQFQFCLKNVLNGVESYTRQYDYYEKYFIDSLNIAPSDVKEKIEVRLSLIKKAFFPVIEANLYRNYKANDETLVEKIPFILTYRFQPSIAMAFEDGRYQNGRNEAVFSNVAAATMLSPEKMYYFYHYNLDSRTELLEHKITAVLNYLGKRKVHCSISFVIACSSLVDNKRREELQKILENLVKKSGAVSGNAILENYEIFDCPDVESAIRELQEYRSKIHIDLYDGSTQLFHSTMDDGQFVEKITNAGIPYFEFDWKRKIFTKHEHCSYLKYIQDNSCIRINDMFTLMNAVDNKFNLPEFAYDYEKLWSIYTGSYLANNKFKFENGVGNWNRLCDTLSVYEENRKPTASISLIDDAAIVKKEMVYFLPSFLYKQASDILSKLKEYGVVDPESKITSYTSENYKLKLTASSEYETALNSVFSDPQSVMYGFDAIRRTNYNGETVIVKCKDPVVVNVDLDPEGKGRQKYSYSILEKLQEEHFITELSQNPEDNRLVSFRYSSERIKKLMTSAGEILEVYTYYQVLKSGYFDDVACGYEFRWETDGVKNELDLVLTKGFRSIIVECKAVQKLDLEYYHKLHSIAEHFGIGTIKVLIGNTYRHNDENINAVNRMQRGRGNQLNIITISNQTKIENIGESLRELMEKK